MAVTELDPAGRLGARDGRLGLLLVPELVGRVMGLERVAFSRLEGGEQLPKRFRHVGAPLELALDDQSEGWALDAADGEEVGAEATGRARDGAGQDGAPDQVDVLAGGRSVRERIGELVEVGEGPLDLVLGQGRIARPGDPLGDPRIDVENLGQSLEADQLALAVEVGCDHDRGGVLGDLTDGAQDVLVGRLADQLGVDHVARVGLLPALVLVGIGAIHDVALEADRQVLAVAVAPRVERNPVGLVFLGARAQDLRDFFGGVVFLGDDQSHRVPHM